MQEPLKCCFKHEFYLFQPEKQRAFAEFCLQDFLFRILAYGYNFAKFNS